MKIRNFKPLFLLLIVSLFLGACGSTSLISTPVENIDVVPVKVSELTEDEKKTWLHKDLISDTIPGISLNRAYAELIGNRKGKKVVVAVLDAGMDLSHEDLDDVLWTNTDERPGNGEDDDNNGYIDDIHGYNFLGESYNEQLEMARILRLKIGSAELQARAKAALEKEYTEAGQNKQRYEQVLQAVINSDEVVKKHLGKSEYTKKEVSAIQTTDQELLQSKSILLQMFNFADSIPEVIKELKEGIKYFTDQLNYNLNVNFDGRKVVGDDPYDFNDRGYGDGNPQNRFPEEDHGTHVAGIIAAERNNGLGMNGVANNVAIMSIRAVSNGDEYDKDVALGIRYAVDNGARIVNCSFGKAFSPNPEWVYDAIRYAAAKDVLLVIGAGNDGLDLDKPENYNYPNDHMGKGTEFADNLIMVGSLTPEYGSEMISSFSNYGSENVDVFAPGSQIYATLPGNTYDYQSGTSMAAPTVSGVAALLWSYYPKLTASQVKKILMRSGLQSKSTVILAGESGNYRSFSNASKSGRMLNAYNALIMADKVTRGDMKL